VAAFTENAHGTARLDPDFVGCVATRWHAQMMAMDGCAVKVCGPAPGGHYVLLVPEVPPRARDRGTDAVVARQRLLRLLLDESRGWGRAGLLTRLLPQEEDSLTDRMACLTEVSMSAVGRAVRSGLPGG